MSRWTRALLLGLLFGGLVDEAAATKPDFSSVSGFGPAIPGARGEEVAKALARLGVPATRDRRAPSGKVVMRCQADAFAPAEKGAWSAVIEVGQTGRVTEVQVTRGALRSEEAAEAELERLRRRYGPPQKAKPEGTGVRYWRHLWSNERVQLRLSIVSDKAETEWHLTQSWVVAPRP